MKIVSIKMCNKISNYKKNLINFTWNNITMKLYLYTENFKKREFLSREKNSY